MIKLYLARLVKQQDGLTLVELIVAVALFGIIIVGTSAVYFQIIAITAESNNHMQAMRQVQNAGYWISQDVQQAMNIDTSDNIATTDATEVLTLNWNYTYSEYGQVKHLVVYSLDNGVLSRTDTMNDTTTTTMMVARDITVLSWDVSKNQVLISATVGGFRPSDAQRTYRIKLRTR
jgi:general secretion pathway protein J